MQLALASLDFSSAVPGPLGHSHVARGKELHPEGQEVLSRALLHSGACWGIYLLEGAGSHRNGQGQAQCGVCRHQPRRSVPRAVCCG